jgi:NAD(P)-dependent dehydrogenase (short-subunit alcohol dehydrogenase family)
MARRSGRLHGPPRRAPARSGRLTGQPREPRERVSVLTGATSGIGRAAAREIARGGGTLALVARDRERAATTVAELRADAPGTAVHVFLGDLGVQSEVRAVAAALLERFPAIDLLVNNAGVVNLRHTTTPDGIETTFAVNHLAYFMLTLLLRPALSASPAARVVSVASDAHKIGRLDFDDLGGARRYRAMRAYGTSKLCNILFTYELARRLRGTTVTANCLHPGAVATRLGQNNGRIATALTKLLRPLFRTPEGGADTVVYLATSPEVAGTTGAYFANRKPIRSSRASYDEALQRRLWDASEALTGVRW